MSNTNDFSDKNDSLDQNSFNKEAVNNLNKKQQKTFVSCSNSAKNKLDVTANRVIAKKKYSYFDLSTSVYTDNEIKFTKKKCSPTLICTEKNIAKILANESAIETIQAIQNIKTISNILPTIIAETSFNTNNIFEHSTVSSTVNGSLKQTEFISFFDFFYSDELSLTQDYTLESHVSSTPKKDKKNVDGFRISEYFSLMPINGLIEQTRSNKIRDAPKKNRSLLVKKTAAVITDAKKN
ncbi:hypothetical protein QEN19_000989 [Hanseniaspora menglaensis]